MHRNYRWSIDWCWIKVKNSYWNARLIRIHCAIKYVGYTTRKKSLRNHVPRTIKHKLWPSTIFLVSIGFIPGNTPVKWRTGWTKISIVELKRRQKSQRKCEFNVRGESNCFVDASIRSRCSIHSEYHQETSDCGESRYHHGMCGRRVSQSRDHLVWSVWSATQFIHGRENSQLDSYIISIAL